MCTVTFVPQPQPGFLLTSNRDEQPERSAPAITTQNARTERIMFPRDAGAGGTWIALSDRGRCVCLLNGAFRHHRRQPPYRRSRGIMALQFFDHASPEDFARDYLFEGMEAFTLIACTAASLHEIRWDEQALHFKQLDATRPHIWSSATLYTPEVQQARETWFREWLTRYPDPSDERMLYFHHHAGTGDPQNDIVMNRDGIVQTTSITQVSRSGDQLRMRYESLPERRVDQMQWELRHEMVG